MNDFCKNLKLCFAVFVGEGSCGELHEGDPETPDIGPDVVIRFVGVRGINPLRGHVGGTAGTPGAGLGVNQATCDVSYLMNTILLKRHGRMTGHGDTVGHNEKAKM